jgi:hypothetical protein
MYNKATKNRTFRRPEAGKLQDLDGHWFAITSLVIEQV